jgi:hypothetical protein
MISQISEEIKQKPFLLQIAKDDIWENVWSIDLSKGFPNRKEINKYLDKNKFKTIALEIIFKNSKNNLFVLGLVFNSFLKTKTPTDFLEKIINEINNFSNFQNFIFKLNQVLLGQKYILCGTPDLIRLGIFNHWFSVGPMLLWKKGWEKQINDKFFEERFSTKPAVVETKLNHQGMSFIYNPQNRFPGFRHWIKSPCSKFENGKWILDKTMIKKYLHDWQDFKIE